MRYNLPLRIIHWGTLLLMMMVFSAVWLGEENKSMMVWHKAFGVLVLILVSIRLVVKLLSNSPTVDLKAKIGHWLLYLMMFVTPVSMLIASAYYKGLVLWGWTIVPLIEENKTISHVFKEIHEFSGNFLLILIIGHAAMALYHHFVKKDDTLSRMR